MVDYLLVLSRQAGKKLNGRQVAQIFGWANIIYFAAHPAGDCKIFCRNPISLKLFIYQVPNFFPILITTVPKRKLNYIHTYIFICISSLGEPHSCR
jgi:hypothetical protein